VIEKETWYVAEKIKQFQQELKKQQEVSATFNKRLTKLKVR